MILFMASVAASREPAIDPTLLAVLSIFGGVAVTAGAGLLGAYIQGRREHKKWVRERRFDAYSDYLTQLRTLDDERTDVDAIAAQLTDLKERESAMEKQPYASDAEGQTARRLLESGFATERTMLLDRQKQKIERLTKLLEDMRTAAMSFALLGPQSVREAVNRDANSTDPATKKARFRRIESAMREALEIDD